MTTTPEARPEWEPVGYFTELKSAMTYRLWEQGGHKQQGDELPLYGPAVHTEMLRVQESERVLREALTLIRGKHGCGALTLPEADLARVDAALKGTP